MIASLGFSASSATFSAPRRCAGSSPTRRACSTILDIEAALARVQARLGIIPARRRRRRSSAIATPRNSISHRLKAADRAHRLSGAAGGAATRCALPRRLGRMVPLGRHDAGHHRYRDRAADPRGAGARRGRSRRRSRRRWRRSRGAIAIRRWPGGQQSAAGDADHLWLQDARCCSPAIERHLQRLRELRPRVLVGEFGGAAGTLASLGADGLRCRRR